MSGSDVLNNLLLFRIDIRNTKRKSRRKREADRRKRSKFTVKRDQSRGGENEKFVIIRFLQILKNKTNATVIT